MAMKPPKGKPPSQRGNRHAKPARESDGLNDTRHVALHEAGHAVAAIVLEIEFSKVEIKRRLIEGGTSEGFTATRPFKRDDVYGKDEETILRHITPCFTGPVAEMRENPNARDHGAFKKDLESAQGIAAMAICELSRKENGETWISPEERNKDRLIALLEAGEKRANAFVAEHWDAIVKVRDLLLRKRELSGDEVAKVVNWS